VCDDLPRIIRAGVVVVAFCSGLATRISQGDDPAKPSVRAVEVHRTNPEPTMPGSSGKRSENADHRDCDYELARCQLIQQRTQHVQNTWMADAVGTATTWTADTLRAAGPGAILDHLEQCDAFSLSNIECEEYPCVLIGTGDPRSCLGPTLGVGPEGFVGRPPDTTAWWTVTKTSGPQYDRRRQEARGQSLAGTAL
jgi:hypothetical protein